MFDKFSRKKKTTNNTYKKNSTMFSHIPERLSLAHSFYVIIIIYLYVLVYVNNSELLKDIFCVQQNFFLLPINNNKIIIFHWHLYEKIII